jgi:hypothetical protein
LGVAVKVTGQELGLFSYVTNCDTQTDLLLIAVFEGDDSHKKGRLNKQRLNVIDARRGGTMTDTLDLLLR